MLPGADHDSGAAIADQIADGAGNADEPGRIGAASVAGKVLIRCLTAAKPAARYHCHYRDIIESRRRSPCGVVSISFPDERVQSLSKAVERNRHRDIVSGGIGKGQLARARSGAHPLNNVILKIEIGKAAARQATRERRRYAWVGIAGLNANIGREGRVHRELNDELDRLALHWLRDGDPRERHVLSLQLGHLPHIADFFRGRAGSRLTLHDPIGIGRSRALRRFDCRRRLRHLLWR